MVDVVLDARVLDIGLTVLDTEADGIYVCSSEPTNYSQATFGGSLALGSKQFTRGAAFGSAAVSSSPAGRKISSDIITDGIVTNSGTPTHWAVVDSTNSRLLARGILTGGVAITSGQLFTLAPFTIVAPGAGVVSDYAAQGVYFDGATYLLGATDTPFAGAADGPSCLISFWFKMQGNDDSTQDLFLNDFGDGLTIIRGNANTWRVSGLSTFGTTTIFQATSVSTFTTPDSWHHLLFARNSSTPLLYIDGVSDITSSTTNAGNVAYSQTGTYSMGASVGGGFKCFLDIADLYIGMNQFIDITNPINLAKFISNGRPVDLGSDGSTPTGVAPLGYFSGSVASWHVNKGTGGDLFTVHGSLTASGTNP